MREGHDPLDKYRKRRDFTETPEPAGQGGDSEGAPIFVIQKHAASRLHYDFRLEVDGVLKSWAVPKGPSLNPRDRRLAMPVEDHPLDYAGFEGSIPSGNYGAGTVIVWDTGTFRNLTERDGEPVSAEEALATGHLRFELVGKKLGGAWALTRVAEGKEERWILVKRRDEHAREVDITQEAPASVLSGRTLEEVAEGK